MADWPCAVCTFINAGPLTLCEMCGTGRTLLPAAAQAAGDGGAPGHPAPAAAAVEDDYVAALAQMGDVQRLVCATDEIRYDPLYAAVRACIRHRDRPAVREWVARYLNRCIGILLVQMHVGAAWVSATNGTLAGVLELAVQLAGDGHFEGLQAAATVLQSGVVAPPSPRLRSQPCSAYWCGGGQPGQEGSELAPESAGIPPERRAVYLHCVRRAALELLPLLLSAVETQLRPVRRDAPTTAIAVDRAQLFLADASAPPQARALALEGALLGGASQQLGRAARFLAPLAPQRLVEVVAAHRAATIVGGAAAGGWAGPDTAGLLVAGLSSTLAAIAGLIACGGNFTGTGRSALSAVAGGAGQATGSPAAATAAAPAGARAGSAHDSELTGVSDADAGDDLGRLLQLGPGLHSWAALARVVQPAMAALTAYCDALSALPDELVKRDAAINDALAGIVSSVELLWGILCRPPPAPAGDGAWVQPLLALLRDCVSVSAVAAEGLPAGVPADMTEEELVYAVQDRLVTAYPQRLRLAYIGAALSSSGLTRRLWALEQTSAYARTLLVAAQAHQELRDRGRAAARRQLAACDEADAARSRGELPWPPLALRSDASRSWAQAAAPAMSEEDHARLAAESARATGALRSQVEAQLAYLAAEDEAAACAAGASPAPRDLALWLLHPSAGGGLVTALTGGASELHEEFLRRAMEPLSLVASHGLLAPHHVDRLWASLLTAHSSTVEVHRELLTRLVEASAVCAPSVTTRLLALWRRSAGCGPLPPLAVEGYDATMAAADDAPFDPAVPLATAASQAEAIASAARLCTWYLSRRVAVAAPVVQGKKRGGKAAKQCLNLPVSDAGCLAVGRSDASPFSQRTLWSPVAPAPHAPPSQGLNQLFASTMFSLLLAPPLSPGSSASLSLSAAGRLASVPPQPSPHAADAATASSAQKGPTLGQSLPPASQSAHEEVAALEHALRVACASNVHGCSAGVTAEGSARSDTGGAVSSRRSSNAAPVALELPLLSPSSLHASICDALLSSLGAGGCDPAATGALLQRTVDAIARHGDALAATASARPAPPTPGARGGGAAAPPPLVVHDPVPLCLELIKRLLRHMHAAGVAVHAIGAPGGSAAVRVTPGGLPGCPSLPQLVRLADAAVQLCHVVFHEAVVYARCTSRVAAGAEGGASAPFVPAAFAKRLAVLITLQRYSLAATPPESLLPADSSSDGIAPVPPTLPPPSLRLAAAHVLQLWAAVNDAPLTDAPASIVPPAAHQKYLAPVNHAPRELFWAWARRVCGGGRWDVTFRRGAHGGIGSGGRSSAQPSDATEALDGAMSSATVGDAPAALSDVTDEAANALLAGRYRATALLPSMVAGEWADAALPQRLRPRSTVALNAPTLPPPPSDDASGGLEDRTSDEPVGPPAALFEALGDPEDLWPATATGANSSRPPLAVPSALPPQQQRPDASRHSQPPSLTLPPGRSSSDDFEQVVSSSDDSRDIATVDSDASSDEAVADLSDLTIGGWHDDSTARDVPPPSSRHASLRGRRRGTTRWTASGAGPSSAPGGREGGRYTLPSALLGRIGAGAPAAALGSSQLGAVGGGGEPALGPAAADAVRDLQPLAVTSPLLCSSDLDVLWAALFDPSAIIDAAAAVSNGHVVVAEPAAASVVVGAASSSPELLGLAGYQVFMLLWLHSCRPALHSARGRPTRAIAAPTLAPQHPRVSMSEIRIQPLLPFGGHDGNRATSGATTSPSDGQAIGDAFKGSNPGGGGSGGRGATKKNAACSRGAKKLVTFGLDALAPGGGDPIRHIAAESAAPTVAVSVRLDWDSSAHSVDWSLPPELPGAHILLSLALHSPEPVAAAAQEALVAVHSTCHYLSILRAATRAAVDVVASAGDPLAVTSLPASTSAAPWADSAHARTVRAIAPLHAQPLVASLIRELTATRASHTGADATTVGIRCLALLRSYRASVQRSVALSAVLAFEPFDAELRRAAAAAEQQVQPAPALVPALPALLGLLPREAARLCSSSSSGSIAALLLACTPLEQQSHRSTCGGVGGDSAASAGMRGRPEVEAQEGGPCTAAVAEGPPSSSSVVCSELVGPLGVPPAQRVRELAVALASVRVCGAPSSTALLCCVHNAAQANEALATTTFSTLSSSGALALAPPRASSPALSPVVSQSLDDARTHAASNAEAGERGGGASVSSSCASLVPSTVRVARLLAVLAATVPVEVSPGCVSSSFHSLVLREEDYHLLFDVLASSLTHSSTPALRDATWATLMELPTSPAVVAALADPASVDWAHLLCTQETTDASSSSRGPSGSSAVAASRNGGWKALYVMQAVAARLRESGGATAPAASAAGSGAASQSWRARFTAAGGFRVIVDHLRTAASEVAAATPLAHVQRRLASTALQVLLDCVDEIRAQDFGGADATTGSSGFMLVLGALLELAVASMASTVSLGVSAPTAPTAPATASSSAPPPSGARASATDDASAAIALLMALLHRRDLQTPVGSIRPPPAAGGAPHPPPPPQLHPVAERLVSDARSSALIGTLLTGRNSAVAASLASQLLVPVLRMRGVARGPIDAMLRSALLSASPTAASFEHVLAVLAVLTDEAPSPGEDADAPSAPAASNLASWAEFCLALVARWWQEGCAQAYALHAASGSAASFEGGSQQEAQNSGGSRFSASSRGSGGLSAEMRRLLYVNGTDPVVESTISFGGSTVQQWVASDHKPLLVLILRQLERLIGRLAAADAAGIDCARVDGVPGTLAALIAVSACPAALLPAAATKSASHAPCAPLIDFAFNLVVGACLVGPSAALPSVLEAPPVLRSLLSSDEPAAPTPSIASSRVYLCHSHPERDSAYCLLRVLLQCCLRVPPAAMSAPAPEQTCQQLAHGVSTAGGYSTPYLAMLGRIEACTLGAPPVSSFNPTNTRASRGGYREPILDQMPLVDAHVWGYQAAAAAPAAVPSLASSAALVTATTAPGATYSGLVNAGCTCYANALLQQLFMVPELRRAILHADIPLPLELGPAPPPSAPVLDIVAGHGGTPAAAPAAAAAGVPADTISGAISPVESSASSEATSSAAGGGGGGGTAAAALQRARLLLELQRTFLWLRGGSLSAYDPRALVEACTVLGLPNPVWQQNDASEFASGLMDVVETGLKGTPEGRHVAGMLSGATVKTKQRLCCGRVDVDPPVPFVFLSLGIREARTLEGALAGHFKGELLSGANAVECPSCAVKATTRICDVLAAAPALLVLHLNRFELDMAALRVTKINERVSFPSTLDMQPFVAPPPPPGDGGAGEAAGSTRYALVGALVHSGTAQSGHYYSFIKDRGDVAEFPASTSATAAPVNLRRTGGTDRWLRFDDQTVTFVDPAVLSAECFGGTAPLASAGHGDKASTGNKPIEKNALLLFYERLPCTVASSSSSSCSGDGGGGGGQPAVTAPTNAPAHIGDISTSSDAPCGIERPPARVTSRGLLAESWTQLQLANAAASIRRFAFDPALRAFLARVAWDRVTALTASSTPPPPLAASAADVAARLVDGAASAAAMTHGMGESQAPASTPPLPPAARSRSSSGGGGSGGGSGGSAAAPWLPPAVTAALQQHGDAVERIAACAALEASAPDDSLPSADPPAATGAPSVLLDSAPAIVRRAPDPLARFAARLLFSATFRVAEGEQGPDSSSLARALSALMHAHPPSARWLALQCAARLPRAVATAAGAGPAAARNDDDGGAAPSSLPPSLPASSSDGGSAAPHAAQPPSPPPSPSSSSPAVLHASIEAAATSSWLARGLLYTPNAGTRLLLLRLLTTAASVIGSRDASGVSPSVAAAAIELAARRPGAAGPHVAYLVQPPPSAVRSGSQALTDAGGSWLQALVRGCPLDHELAQLQASVDEARADEVHAEGTLAALRERLKATEELLEVAEGSAGETLCRALELEDSVAKDRDEVTRLTAVLEPLAVADGHGEPWRVVHAPVADGPPRMPQFPSFAFGAMPGGASTATLEFRQCEAALQAAAGRVAAGDAELARLQAASEGVQRDIRRLRWQHAQFKAELCACDARKVAARVRRRAAWLRHRSAPGPGTELGALLGTYADLFSLTSWPQETCVERHWTHWDSFLALGPAIAHATLRYAHAGWVERWREDGGISNSSSPPAAVCGREHEIHVTRGSSESPAPTVDPTSGSAAACAADLMPLGAAAIMLATGYASGFAAFLSRCYGSLEQLEATSATKLQWQGVLATLQLSLAPTPSLQRVCTGPPTARPSDVLLEGVILGGGGGDSAELLAGFELDSFHPPLPRLPSVCPHLCADLVAPSLLERLLEGRAASPDLVFGEQQWVRAEARVLLRVLTQAALHARARDLVTGRVLAFLVPLPLPVDTARCATPHAVAVHHLDEDSDTGGGDVCGLAAVVVRRTTSLTGPLAQSAPSLAGPLGGRSHLLLSSERGGELGTDDSDTDEQFGGRDAVVHPPAPPAHLLVPSAAAAAAVARLAPSSLAAMPQLALPAPSDALTADNPPVLALAGAFLAKLGTHVGLCGALCGGLADCPPAVRPAWVRVQLLPRPLVEAHYGREAGGGGGEVITHVQPPQRGSPFLRQARCLTGGGLLAATPPWAAYEEGVSLAGAGAPAPLPPWAAAYSFESARVSGTSVAFPCGPGAWAGLAPCAPPASIAAGGVASGARMAWSGTPHHHAASGSGGSATGVPLGSSFPPPEGRPDVNASKAVLYLLAAAATAAAPEAPLPAGGSPLEGRATLQCLHWLWLPLVRAGYAATVAADAAQAAAWRALWGSPQQMLARQPCAEALLPPGGPRPAFNEAQALGAGSGGAASTGGGGGGGGGGSTLQLGSVCFAPMDAHAASGATAALDATETAAAAAAAAAPARLPGFLDCALPARWDVGQMGMYLSEHARALGAGWWVLWRRQQLLRDVASAGVALRAAAAAAAAGTPPPRTSPSSPSPRPTQPTAAAASLRLALPTVAPRQAPVRLALPLTLLPRPDWDLPPHEAAAGGSSLPPPAGSSSSSVAQRRRAFRVSGAGLPWANGIYVEAPPGSWVAGMARSSGTLFERRVGSMVLSLFWVEYNTRFFIAAASDRCAYRHDTLTATSPMHNHDLYMSEPATSKGRPPHVSPASLRWDMAMDPSERTRPCHACGAGHLGSGASRSELLPAQRARGLRPVPVPPGSRMAVVQISGPPLDPAAPYEPLALTAAQASRQAARAEAFALAAAAASGSSSSSSSSLGARGAAAEGVDGDGGRSARGPQLPHFAGPSHGFSVGDPAPPPTGGLPAPPPPAHPTKSGGSVLRGLLWGAKAGGGGTGARGAVGAAAPAPAAGGVAGWIGSLRQVLLTSGGSSKGAADTAHPRDASAAGSAPPLQPPSAPAARARPVEELEEEAALPELLALGPFARDSDSQIGSSGGSGGNGSNSDNGGSSSSSSSSSSDSSSSSESSSSSGGSASDSMSRLMGAAHSVADEDDPDLAIALAASLAESERHKTPPQAGAGGAGEPAAATAAATPAQGAPPESMMTIMTRPRLSLDADLDALVMGGGGGARTRGGRSGGALSSAPGGRRAPPAAAAAAVARSGAGLGAVRSGAGGALEQGLELALAAAASSGGGAAHPPAHPPHGHPPGGGHGGGAASGSGTAPRARERRSSTSSVVSVSGRPGAARRGELVASLLTMQLPGAATPEEAEQLLQNAGWDVYAAVGMLLGS